MFELAISYTIFDMATSNLNKVSIYNKKPYFLNIFLTNLRNNKNICASSVDLDGVNYLWDHIKSQDR